MSGCAVNETERKRERKEKSQIRGQQEIRQIYKFGSIYETLPDPARSDRDQDACTERVIAGQKQAHGITRSKYMPDLMAEPA